MLHIENLRKTFPGGAHDNSDVVAVDDVSLDVEEGQLYTLLGPSGCGKTTTLRMVAGLEQPDRGRIEIADRTLYDSEKRVNVEPNRRGLGMVFQSYAIWPHMTCFQNVAFPLSGRRRGRRITPREQLESRVHNVLDLVQLGHLGERQATDLSGGQQQRLALARALVADPPMLLLDEPLSNLDAKLREDMRFELKRIQRELGITALYVTHDQTEALAMSNVMAVMRHGRIEQFGKPRDIYDKPASRFVADFIGMSNFLDGVVDDRVQDGAWLVRCAIGPVRARSTVEVHRGQDVTISIRPEHIVIHEGGTSQTEPNVCDGKVESRAFLGEVVDHVVTAADSTIRVRTNPSRSIRPDSEVVVTLPEEHCNLVPVDPA